ncbi:MAG: rhodanese-like domain-containing protein [Gammaproteobacteria bacterium]
MSAGGALWMTLRGAVASLEPSAAALFAKQTGAVFLDVRGGEEFSSGHIAGAKNIPAAELGGSLERLGKYKEKGIVVVCGNGMNSKKAAATLTSGGFGNLRVLAGGMAAWHEAQLPTGKGRR